MSTIDKIALFLSKHHVLSLATQSEEGVYCSNLFYVYDEKSRRFIVASDEKTEHIKHLKHSLHVAGSVVLETKLVGKIEGIQFKAKMLKSQSKEDDALYFKQFAYAKVMKPTFYVLHVEWVKLTDNTLGFGKKLIWEI